MRKIAKKSLKITFLFIEFRYSRVSLMIYINMGVHVTCSLLCYKLYNKKEKQILKVYRYNSTVFKRIDILLSRLSNFLAERRQAVRIDETFLNRKKLQVL